MPVNRRWLPKAPSGCWSSCKTLRKALCGECHTALLLHNRRGPDCPGTRHPYKSLQVWNLFSSYKEESFAVAVNTARGLYVFYDFKCCRYLIPAIQKYLFCVNAFRMFIKGVDIRSQICSMFKPKLSWSCKHSDAGRNAGAITSSLFQGGRL